VTYLYWIPKLHKALNTLLVPKMFHDTSVNTVHKSINCSAGMRQMYCATVCARSGADQIYIFKISKEFLKSFNSLIFFQINSIKTYHFTTIYTTIPHDKYIKTFWHHRQLLFVKVNLILMLPLSCGLIRMSQLIIRNWSPSFMIRRDAYRCVFMRFVALWWGMFPIEKFQVTRFLTIWLPAQIRWITHQ
jgi:hypothetical protein